jgi:L-threonylcarbamoyladenylate synthase
VSTVETVMAAVEAGELVVIPTDTVYGLACRPDREEPVRALSLLKGRGPGQPVALLAASVDALLELVPELPSRRLLAGPFTLVLPNPERRLPWLTGSRPDTIGIRLPVVDGVVAELLARMGVLAATSANLHGGSDPRRLEDVPTEILAVVGAALDGGELPGAPSTVIDLVGDTPRVLREGAVPAAEALSRLPE